MNQPYYQDDSVTLYHGDCIDVMHTFPDASVDAVVTDPPYELGYAGKAWDSTGIAFDPDMWAECLRVTKPGGWLLSFGGTRTWHRMAVAVEDAGWILRDQIAWLYRSGMPHGTDIAKVIEAHERGYTAESKGVRRATEEDGWNLQLGDTARQWDGWTTALKPAFEPIIMAQKSLDGTIATNVLTHGVGGLNIDALRIHSDDDFVRRFRTLAAGTGSNRSGCSTLAELRDLAARGLKTPGGRDARATLARFEAASRRGLETGNPEGNRYPPNVLSANDIGLDEKYWPSFRECPKAQPSERPQHGNLRHHTVKPLDLMRWLVRLITPPNGLVLEPFAGSGTTAEACIHEHKKCIAIEREADYLPLIVARLSKPIEVGFDFGAAT